MSKLSERVIKAKLLRFTPTGKTGQFNTWGSKDNHYIVSLKSSSKEIVTPDGFLAIKVFETHCQKQWYELNLKKSNSCDCKGNIQHTICYHCLGAIWWSFKLTNKQVKVSFYETYQDADRALAFGGFIAEVVNQNGKGIVWAVVRGSKIEKATPQLLPDKAKILESAIIGDAHETTYIEDETYPKILDVKTNINLLRGKIEESEGID